MKVIDSIRKADRPLFTFELLPPRKGGKIDHLFDTEFLSVYRVDTAGKRIFENVKRQDRLTAAYNYFVAKM